MQFKTLVSAALAAALASAQSNTTNLTSLIAGNSQLSALGQFLTQFPTVESSLANVTNATLFLPNNDALGALMQTIQSTGQNVTSDFVTALLNYHTVRGVFYQTNLSSTPAFPHTYLNNTAYSNVTGGQVVECRTRNNGSTVAVYSGLRENVTVQSSTNYTSGVVHIINGVLSIPGNLTSTATAANLTAFLGALQAANLSSTANALHDVTIFAPSNSAFQSIGSATGNLTAAQIASILEYHVINGTVAYSSGLTNGTVRSLAGGNLTVTVERGAVFVNAARVINSDILISGGVLHIIDSVLNPNASSNATATATAPATGYSGASSQTTVPYTSGQVTPMSTNPALETTISNIASDYSSTASSIGANPAATSHSTSSGGAAMPTGAMGAAALFGGAAFLANL